MLFYLYKIEPCFDLNNQDEEHENKGKEESCEADESSASEKEDASDEVGKVVFFLFGGGYISMLCLCCFLFFGQIFNSKKNQVF